MSNPKLIHVLGVTNSGKTTLMDVAEQRLPNVGLVEVGRVLRAKYPPEHFKGQGNPKHTANEAWEIYCTLIKQHTDNGRKAIFISGQPRDMQQLRDIQLQFSSTYPCWFVHLFASPAELQRRAMLRDKGNQAAIELSLARLKNDPPQVFEIINNVHCLWPNRLISVNTEAEGYSPIGLAKNLL